jgi:hypothetical protein
MWLAQLELAGSRLDFSDEHTSVQVRHRIVQQHMDIATRVRCLCTRIACIGFSLALLPSQAVEKVGTHRTVVPPGWVWIEDFDNGATPRHLRDDRTDTPPGRDWWWALMALGPGVGPLSTKHSGPRRKATA